MSTNETYWPGGFSAACLRNREPILEILRSEIDERSKVFEIGSCTGQHAVYFSAAMPGTVWQPSDQSIYLPGLKLNISEYAGANVLPPIVFDVVCDELFTSLFDVIYSANTLHIMSKAQVKAFFLALREILDGNGKLLIYGPFNYSGQHISESNKAFDASLQRHNPLMGIRDFEWVNELAISEGFFLKNDYVMPSNNRLLVWSYKNE